LSNIKWARNNQRSADPYENEPRERVPREACRMKREYPESPLVGVGAVIVKENRVLLIRRGTPPLLGEWSLPGGVLECGETLREAVAREAREETGLAVEPGEMLGVYERVIRDDEGRVRYHYVLIDFLCRAAGGDLKAGSDAADVRWFTRDELPALNLAYDANDVVRKGLART
jgi:ADP-ribose pyrophosphatase YjhB (NUDIX family)